jgi:Carboxypeptidase regulatory-like domain
MGRRIAFGVILLLGLASWPLLSALSPEEERTPSEPRQSSRREEIRKVEPQVEIVEETTLDPEVAASDREAPPPPGLAGLLVEIDTDEEVPRVGAEVEVLLERGSPARGVMDENGQVRFDLTPADDVVVIARLEGFMRAHASVDLEAGSVREKTLYPKRIAHVTGTIRSSDGRVIAGATVRSYHDGFSVHPWCGTCVDMSLRPPLGVAVTDAKGAFSVAVEKGGGYITVAARAPWHRPGHVTRFDSDEDWADPWDIALEPASALRGTVRDAGGDPRPGARVLAVARNDFDLDPEHPLARLDLDHAELEDGWLTDDEVVWKALRTETDEDGRFVLHGLAPGAVYHAWAIADGHAASVPAADVIAPATGGTVDRDFRLRAPASLEIVIRRPDGSAPESVVVDLRTDGRRRGLSLRNTSRIPFEGLVPGNYALDLRVPGFVPVRQDLDLTKGERHRLELALDGGAAISGIVVDDQGTPVPAADIEVEWNEEARSLERGDITPEGKAVTDAEGRFRVTGLRAGPYLVSVSTQEVDLHEKPAVAPQEKVRIIAPRKGGFRFRLEFPGTAPAEVRLEHFTQEPRFGTSTATEFGTGEVPVYETTGRTAGPLRFQGRVEGFVPFGWDLTIEPGRILDLGTVLLDPGVTLEGIVKDDRGQPFLGLRIQASGKTWGQDIGTHAEVDAEGRFRLGPIPKTEVRIRATWKYRRIFETTLLPGGSPTPVTWIIPRPCRLLVLVTDPEGLPITGVSLRAHGLDGAPSVTWDAEYASNEKGRIAMTLAPGRYRLTLVRRGKPIPVGEHRFEPGATVERTFVVEPR